MTSHSLHLVDCINCGAKINEIAQAFNILVQLRKLEVFKKKTILPENALYNSTDEGVDDILCKLGVGRDQMCCRPFLLGSLSIQQLIEYSIANHQT